MTEDDLVKCPACREFISKLATKCPKCQSVLVAQSSSSVLGMIIGSVIVTAVGFLFWMWLGPILGDLYTG
jgi:hypothetical protein